MPRIGVSRSSGRMNAVVFAALVAATLGGMLLVVRSRNEPPAVEGFRWSRWLSPTAASPSNVARVSFRMVRSDRLAVEVTDESGRPVRLLRPPREARDGQRITLRWDGRDALGRVVSDGRYRVRAHLTRQARSITLPVSITVNTKPPRPRVIQ